MLQDIPKPGAHHKRMTQKASAPATAEQLRFREWVRERGCLVCSCPAEAHHVTAGIYGGRFSRSHWMLAPLCFNHHSEQGYPDSLHSTSHAAFYDNHGIDLEAEARALHQLYLAETAFG